MLMITLLCNQWISYVLVNGLNQKNHAHETFIGMQEVIFFTTVNDCIHCQA
jgi:hypothetical protein